MRIMYVAPRFHTNQIPVVKGWLASGHQVCFASQFVAELEDYSVLNPELLGYAPAFEMLTAFWKLGRRLFGKKTAVKQEFDMRIKLGFPSGRKLRQLMRQFRPELVIMRERSLYNVPVYLYCKRHGIDSILYNQSPLWDMPNRDKSLKKKLFLKMLPKKRITPVYGNPGEGKAQLPDSWYVPFVIEPHIAPEAKQHFQNGHIQVVCISRYEERKQLFILLEAMQELFEPYDLLLTVAGEAVDEEQSAYYDAFWHQVEKWDLAERVILKKNLTMTQVYEEYAKADLFVLPSTRERASISQLEAMSCSLPVICSDTNGSACYVEEGVNGWLFRDRDKTDLQRKIRQIVSNREQLLAMSAASWRLVKEKYGFENYYQKVREIIR